MYKLIKPGLIILDNLLTLYQNLGFLFLCDISLL